MEETVAVFIPIVAIVGGLSFAAFGVYSKMRARELMYRERLAMIERGLTPPPLREADLDDFPRPRRHSSRHAGVFFIALGLGMAVLIGANDEGLNKAIGVGGVFVLVGLGLAVNAYLDRREAEKLNAASDQGLKTKD